LLFRHAVCPLGYLSDGWDSRPYLGYNFIALIGGCSFVVKSPCSSV